jgi:hypothetical protein
VPALTAHYFENLVEMRAIQLSSLVSGPDDLRITDLADLKFDLERYVGRIRVAAVNFFDNLQMKENTNRSPLCLALQGTNSLERLSIYQRMADSPNLTSQTKALEQVLEHPPRKFCHMRI